MKIAGSYTFEGAPREMVWEMFLDPDVLAKTMPGCEALEKTGANTYEGQLKIKVGPVQGLFNGTVELGDLVAPESYTLAVDGKGPAGFVNGTGNIRLEISGADTTMHYEGDAQVGGRIASVGQRLMDSSARAITRQSLEALDRQIQARLSGDSLAESAAPALAAPSQTEFAVGVIRDVTSDLLTDDQQRLLVVMLGLLGTLLVTRALINAWTRRLARQVARFIREEEV